MCSGSEAGSYSRLIDSCITQLKAQGPSRTCNESKEEEEALEPLARRIRETGGGRSLPAGCAPRIICSREGDTLLNSVRSCTHIKELYNPTPVTVQPYTCTRYDGTTLHLHTIPLPTPAHDPYTCALCYSKYRCSRRPRPTTRSPSATTPARSAPYPVYIYIYIYICVCVCVCIYICI